MSIAEANSPENALVTPVISADVIDKTLAAAKADPAAFCAVEAAALSDGPLSRVYNEREKTIALASPDEARQWGIAYLMAHRILQSAAMESGCPLPQFGGTVAQDYVYLIDRDHERLGIDFDRDYRYIGHAGVVRLVEDFNFPANRNGAMIMFNLHGRWANPARGPIHIPHQVSRAGSSRRRSQGFVSSR